MAVDSRSNFKVDATFGVMYRSDARVPQTATASLSRAGGSLQGHLKEATPVALASAVAVPAFAWMVQRRRLRSAESCGNSAIAASQLRAAMHETLKTDIRNPKKLGVLGGAVVSIVGVCLGVTAKRRRHLIGLDTEASATHDSIEQHVLKYKDFDSNRRNSVMSVGSSTCLSARSLATPRRAPQKLPTVFRVASKSPSRTPVQSETLERWLEEDEMNKAHSLALSKAMNFNVKEDSETSSTTLTHEDLEDEEVEKYVVGDHPECFPIASCTPSRSMFLPRRTGQESTSNEDGHDEASSDSEASLDQ